MSDSEARYRAALRWYSKQWRAEHEETVLGTLLDADEQDRDRRPSRVRAEVVTLALHGLANRCAFVTTPATRDLAAAIGLAAGAAYALFQLLTFDLYAIGGLRTALRLASSPFEAVASASIALPALWALAVGAALLRLRALRSAALLGVPVAVLATVIPRLVEHSAGGVSRYALLFEAATAAVALCGSPRRRTLVATLLAWTALFAVIAVGNDSFRGTVSIWIWALGPFNAAGLTIGLAATALAVGALLTLQHVKTAGAVVLSATPWVLLLVAELVTGRTNAFPLDFAVRSLGFLGLCGVVLVLLHRRSRRRLLGAPVDGVPAHLRQ